MFRLRMVAVAALAAAGGMFAQDQGPGPQKVFFQRTLVGPDDALPPAGGGNMTFVSAEMSFEGKTVTGSPYTAEAVTESTQTLADGNRIVQTTQGLVARDSEGRTRREASLMAQGEPMKLVTINDPVAQISYILHPDHTADKLPLTKGPVAFAAGGYGIAIGSGAATASASMVKTNVAPSAQITGTITSKATVESLGQQTVEGVQAEGKRSTSVIPAGTIGNELDIKTVSETWYSSELQTTVSSTRSDPRMGTTTYRLTNIQRAEPSPDLFQVPSDYTVHDMPKSISIETKVAK